MDQLLKIGDECILYVNENIYPYSHRTVFFQNDFVDAEVDKLANLAGLPASQLKFVLSLFLVYILSIIYRFVPTYRLRLVFNLVVGIWLLQVLFV